MFSYNAIHGAGHENGIVFVVNGDDVLDFISGWSIICSNHILSVNNYGNNADEVSDYTAKSLYNSKWLHLHIIFASPTHITILLFIVCISVHLYMYVKIFELFCLILISVKLTKEYQN